MFSLFGSWGAFWCVAYALRPYCRPRGWFYLRISCVGDCRRRIFRHRRDASDSAVPSSEALCSTPHRRLTRRRSQPPVAPAGEGTFEVGGGSSETLSALCESVIPVYCFLHWLASARFLRTLAMLGLLAVLLWRSIVWALQPGWWSGSYLGGVEDTTLEEARRHFGPILMTTWWIRDPPEAWQGLSREQVLQNWGSAETTARLLLILAVLFVLFSALALWRTWVSAQPLVGANRHEPAASSLP